jgi:hypothetical protein
VPLKTSSSTVTFVPLSVLTGAQIFPPHVDSPICMVTQTTSDKNEDFNIGTQTCVLKDNATQTQSEQVVESVGLQTHSCGRPPLSTEFEKNEGWRLCHEHYKAVRSCGSCEFQELEENKSVQTIDWMDTKVCTPY